MRECNKCGAPTPPDGFYESNRKTCKECIKARTRANRRKRVEYHREYDRKRARDPDRREHIANVVRRMRKNHPEKYSAHIAVSNALRDGKLHKRPCERCERTDHVHAHHDDYSKPLDVMWLCPVHHKERHKELALYQREDDGSLMREHA